MSSIDSPNRLAVLCGYTAALFAVPIACGEDELAQRRFAPFSLAGSGHHLEVSGSDAGRYTVNTTGTDPYIRTIGAAEEMEPFTAYFIGFQYKAPVECEAFQVLMETPIGLRHFNSRLEKTDSWSWHFVDLSKLREPVKWLRFDFGNHNDRQFQVRDLRLIRAEPEFDVTKLEHFPFSLKEEGHHAEIESLPNGEIHVSTTGNDPYVSTKGMVPAHDPSIPYIIAFEYQAPPDFGDIVFHYGTTEGNFHSDAGVKEARGWTWHLFDFSDDGEGIGAELKRFRFDFGSREGLRFKIRNCRLIRATPELRLRAAVGDKAEQVDQFGISIKDVEPQNSAIETVRELDEKSIAVTLSAFRHLDLDAETKRFADLPSTAPPVPLGPRIVAGQGEHPDNHTVVRVLSRYQVCETQFLAFPPNIRGGVGVETGLNNAGRSFIAAWPVVSQESRAIRLFNPAGGSIGSIAVAKRLRPPFTVVTGDFDLDREGDEIAVAQRFLGQAGSSVLIYSTSGDEIASFPIPESTSKQSREICLLNSETSGLLVQDLSTQVALPLHSAGDSIDFSEADRFVRLFDSAFEDRDFNLGGREDRVSSLSTVKEGEIRETFDVGRMENIFWFDPQEVHNGSHSTWGTFPDGKYIRNSKYNFLGAAQWWSPLLKSGEIEGRSYREWTEDIDWERSAFGGAHRKSIKDYDSGVPTTWTAAFTHRWPVRLVDAISSQLDPNTWQPKYLLLNRSNETTGGGYFGKRLFDYGSQNLEQETLDKFYTYNQRAFHRRLAPAYRNNPEMTLAIEPNHENEIVSGSQSVGDYNSKNIEGFYQYLIALYGNLDGINRMMGSGFSEEFFDAPRNLLRGDWDKYQSDKLFFREWVEYNRTVIYRRIGAGYREALLAGFPSEMLKCHQIPDTYVFGSIVGISEGDVRISPIDWLLTTGAGFGFSRYGTYYKREHNIGQGAHSSGYDNMLIGEYASLNPSHEDALGQLLYLRDRGVSSLHVMWWPSDRDKGYNKAQESALREMIAKHDLPRRGLAGGVGHVRPWQGMDIASLGTADTNTGLIKSLKVDGSFEGSVYTVPFHAHVDIDVLRGKDQMQITESPTDLAIATGVRQGAVFEITFTIDDLDASAEEIRVDFHHAGIELKDKGVILDPLAIGQQVRVIYRVPLILDEVAFTLATAKGVASITDVSVVRHQDQAINLTRRIMQGKRHQGGVMFDVLPE